MGLKKIASLENGLLILMVSLLMSSVAKYMRHETHWLLWITAGLLAVTMVRRPRLTGALFFAALTILIIYGFFDSAVTGFAGELTGEFREWIQDPYYAGPGLIKVAGMLTVFAVVGLQSIAPSRSVNIMPLILLGITTYALLWFNRYPDAEYDLIMFLVLAFPTAAMHYVGKRSDLSRAWYRAGVLCQGLACGIAVVILPWNINPPDIIKGTGFFAFRVETPGLTEDNGYFPPGTARRAGYSPEGELGGSITKSPEPVMEIELMEGAFPLALYLRGRAMDYYTGRSWEKRHAQPAGDLGPAFSYLQVYENEIKALITYLHPEEDLFGLYPTTGIELIEFRVDSFGNLQVPHPPYEGSYILTGKTLTHIDLDGMDPRAELIKDLSRLRPFLQIPEELPQRVIGLAGEIAGGAETELAVVRKIMEYLRQLPYTTDTPPLPGTDDFVDHFLFDLREGYCTYYASAMVLLLRLQGIPARYVAGYRVTPYQEQELIDLQHIPDWSPPGRMLARRMNAHAWVEVFLQGYGWVAFEPTPAFEISQSLTDYRREPHHEKEGGEEILTPPGENSGFNLLYAGIFPAAAIFFMGSAAAYFRLSRVAGTRDLYYWIVRIKSIFYRPPALKETPGRIIEELKKDFPKLAADFELLKEDYQTSCYARLKDQKNGRLASKPSNLPLITALSYKEKLGLIRYVYCWMMLLLDILFRSRRQRK